MTQKWLELYHKAIIETFFLVIIINILKKVGSPGTKKLWNLPKTAGETHSIQICHHCFSCAVALEKMAIFSCPGGTQITKKKKKQKVSSFWVFFFVYDKEWSGSENRSSSKIPFLQVRYLSTKKNKKIIRMILKKIKLNKNF